MYKVIRRHLIEGTSSKDKVEVRMAEVNKGYSVAVWDLVNKEYPAYPLIRIFPYSLLNPLKKANVYFTNLIESETKLRLDKNTQA